ncbi:MAG: dTMP kinase [Candidatus Harrisonbacteria bacterium RIFCSPHIGHO2_01_FULL_44_13]|uniref:Thymidylate kinase n=1 Tax=Candidatus Harrisonbacteria bacterium RIFCSPLOWO2_01_FULL_44_18 TaxID=1798407 RepID=A0A1G1ZKZ4_9BACT|nr:MAG: dTMP kinase [Candidatus Harrisonbacteria bacterium RIFCSPHIGHO2_01_FULL_44_13]OGY65308.1 MAG: dTMP kinase [Candidatus Harrisonbacteria bacterium RIFCSPLOWO2_01_FULL_44_18]
MTKNGLFIVFEGGEGSGKTTLSKWLYEWLSNQGYYALWTKEPGGDQAVCDKIRKILLDPAHKGVMSPRAELPLFEADRAQHVDSVIKPALSEGKIVVCDRFSASTFAYQCFARKVCRTDDFDGWDAFATNRLYPDLTFWIDIDPELGMSRNAQDGKHDRFELEDLEFHKRVREGFEIFFRDYPWDWEKLDGSLPLEVLERQVIEKTLRLIP